MKSKKIYFIIFFTVFSILSGVVYYLYNSMSFRDKSLLEAVPSSSVNAILNTKNSLNFVNRLKDTTLLLNELNSISSLTKITKPLIGLIDNFKTLDDTATLSTFLERPSIISVHSDDSGNLFLLYAFNFKNRNERNSLLSVLEPSVKDEVYENFQIFKFFNKEVKQQLYFTLNEGLIVFSDSKSIIKESIKQQHSPSTSLMADSEFIKVLQLSRNINFENLFLKNGSYLNSTNSLVKRLEPYLLSNITGWSEFDIDYKNDIISMNGIILEQKDHLYLIEFLNNNFGAMTLDNVYPAYISNFVNYSFNDSTFFSRYRTFLNYIYKSSNFKYKTSYNLEFDELIDPLLMVMYGEFGLANNLSTDSLLIIKVNSITSAKEVIANIGKQTTSEISEVEKWQVDLTLSLSIYKGLPDSVITYLFAPFFQAMPNKYHIFFDNYLVLSNNIDELKRFYKNYLTKNSLANDSYFQQFRSNFSSEENLYIYSRSNSLESIFSNKDIKSQTKNFQFSIASQLMVNNSTFFSSYILNRSEYIQTNENYEWKCVLDSSLNSFLSIIKDPQNSQQNYLVQDSKYNLYLINTIGRVIWKRPINEKILGGITQLYINSKPQNSLIFNTQSKLFQIDFEGNGIGNYPVLLPSMAVESLSLFDYDKNGDFRLFVACDDNQIRVYDRKGNLVVGFESEKIEGNILQPIQHFLVSDKDYILFSDEYSNRILDRKGKQRIDIKSDFKRSPNSSYYLLKEGTRDYFITSSTLGEVVKIEIPSGEVTKILSYTDAKEHYFFLVNINKKEQAYLFISDNSIKLLDTKGLVIYNNVLSNLSVNIPRLIYNKDGNPFISFMDLASNKVYLIDVINGVNKVRFPVNGNSDYQIIFDEFGGTKTLTGGELNTMVLYN